MEKMSDLQPSHYDNKEENNSRLLIGDRLTTSSASKNAIERKLELLERRFTMPIDSSPKGNKSENVTAQNSPESALMIDSLPGKTVDYANPNSSNHSRSFHFDTPSLSYQSISHLSQPSLLVINDASINSDKASNGIRLKVNETIGLSNGSHSSSHVWKDVMAAGKQMTAKVGGCANDSRSRQGFMDYLQSQNSNPTIITSHIKNREKTIIAQETPRNDSSPRDYEKLDTGDHQSNKKKDSAFATAFSHIPEAGCTTEVLHLKQSDSKQKRKSLPSKREAHSVKESTLSDVFTQQGNAMKENKPNQLYEKDAATERLDIVNTKRRRLVFDAPLSNDPSTTVADSQQSIRAGNNDNEVVQKVFSPTNRRNNSPLQPIVTRADQSHDNSRPTKSVNRLKTSGLSNNSSICDFFQSFKKTRKLSEGTAPLSLKSDSPRKTSLKSSSTDVESANNTEKQVIQQSDEIMLLKKKCKELEQACLDKDQQLNAVANNRTILYSALKTAIQQKDEEIRSLEVEKEKFAVSARVTLEKFVRREASQRARDIREKLAADSSKLGRIVHTRTGSMIGRSAHVENWEDGSAAHELEAKRSSISAKRKVLEQRLKNAIAELTRLKDKVRSPSKNNNTVINSEEGAQNTVESHTILEATEAVESTRMHLTRLHQEEKELLLEEQGLNDEKGSHIHALKRVANENASRFRSRPKLHDRYILQELLGRGGFSEVWRAFDLVDLREVAVKIHQLDPRWSEAKKENYTKHVSREYEIHRNVRHPRIVSLFDVFEIDNNSFATVLECCDGTDLETLLKTKRRLPERDARSILLQIITGMLYLSQPSSDGTRQGIIHYDLKPGNILFDEFGDAKITDFGLSKIVDAPDPAESMELTSQGAGTYWYLPPECFVTSDSVRISNKVDVWSIGVIFYQMLFGRRPFGDSQSQEKLVSNQTMLNAHDVTFPERPEVSKGCKQFIRACLTYDQAFRPTIAQLSENSYLTSNEFE